ncbi:MAG: hypothetical protein WCL00_00665 [Bacteroidota bacterium]
MKILKFTVILIALTGLTLSGCKKDKQNNLSADSSTLQQLSKDENTVTNVSDQTLNDVNTLLSGGSSLKSTESVPCNAWIDSIAVSNDTITKYIHYNGLSCNGTHFRTGKIEVKKRVGTNWHDAGATVIVTYINFSITKVATGKTLVLNGTKTFQNVTGGYLFQLGNGYSSIVHKVSGYMVATFDDNSTRTWYIARQKTFTGTIGQLVLTVDGFGQSGSFSNLVVWGTNRNGDNFYTQITQSVAHKEVCDWDPCSGIKVHQIPSKDKKATLTFGYDNNNQLITNGDCPTKYKLDWEIGTNSGTLYLFLL